MITIHSTIPPEVVKAYADARKVSQLDAFRALYSQRLLDLVDDGDIHGVLRELIHQVIGEGVKK